MRLLLAVLPLAGCSQILGLEDLHRIDSGITADDLDGDAVLNADDNCPEKPNSNQANEDGDEFGDVCDPCPPFGMPSDNADSDRDGVGDACDLSPGADTITMFEGFNAAPFGVLQSDGCWSFANGEAIVAGDSAGSSCQMLWPRMLAAGHQSYSITTGMTITGSEGPALSVRRAGILDETDAIDGESVICEYGTGSNDDQTLILYNTVTNTTIAMSAADAAIGTPTIAKLSLSSGGGYRCSALPVAPLITGPPQLNMQSPRIGLHARAVDVTFSWIMVVSGP